MAAKRIAKKNRGYKTDLARKKFGRLTVLRFIGVIKRKRHWRCLCDCGKRSLVQAHFLITGNTKSCGCLSAEMSAARKRIHGETTRTSQSVEYRCWRLIKARCYTPRNNMYKNYGARGIQMCDRWRYGEEGLDGYQCFLFDMGRKPTNKHSIDRIDVNGNYEKKNCRWATAMEQGANQRRNVYLTHNGERLHMAEWARRTGIKAYTLSIRLNQLKWSVEKTLTTPLYFRKS